jgi:DNA-binding transcriptional MerR regulator
MEPACTAGEVCRLAGIAYARLNHWARTGLVVPTLAQATGRGSRRKYSWQDLVALRAVARLRERGLSLQALRRSVEYLRANLPEVERPLSDLTLVTDGHSLFAICRSPQEAASRIIDALRGGQLVMAVALGDMVTAEK